LLSLKLFSFTRPSPFFLLRAKERIWDNKQIN